MSDVRVGSTSVAILPAQADVNAAWSAQGPHEAAPSLDAISTDAGGQNWSTSYGAAASSISYLPDTDDSALTLDIRRIITEANQQRSDDTRERALNAAARIEDMVAQYNAAMERFREAYHLAQLAMSEGVGQDDAYSLDAAAGADEAQKIAQEMSALAGECGEAARVVADLAESATARADAAVAQAEALAGALQSGASPSEHAAALAARLTSPLFVPANEVAVQLTATALMQIAEAYNANTASQLAPTLVYWTDIAEQHLAAGTTCTEAPAPAPADSVAAPAPTPAPAPLPALPAAVAVQGNPFWSIGDPGVTGQESVAGQVVTGDQYLQDKPIVFVTRTVDEIRYTEFGESSYATTVQVQRQVAISIGEAARELNLDAAGAAAYLDQHGAYLINGYTIGTRSEFEAIHGRSPAAAERAYLVRAESTIAGESGDYVMPAIYGGAPQHLRSAGYDLGVYEVLPADVRAAAQASTGGNVLLASSAQTTTVRAHLDEQSLVFIERAVTELAYDNGGEGGYRSVLVTRQVPVPSLQATTALGLTGSDATEYMEAHRAYMMGNGRVGTRAMFEATMLRAPTEADRAYIVQAPTLASGESGDVTTAAQLGSEAAYLGLIGLSTATPRDLTISFNGSYSASGDAYLDTSHRTIDLTQNNTSATRAYHAVANDALAAEWVQIGDKGPINDDLEKIVGEVYGQLGADTPEKQEAVRRMMFRYDPTYGVLANRALVEGAAQMNNSRRQGFFEGGFGRALITVAATVVGGPALAAGVAAAFTAYDGGSFADVVRSGAAAYAGGAVGAGVGNAVTSSLVTSGLSTTAIAGVSGFAQGVSSSATSQLITTGRIDGDSLLQAGVAGGVGGATTTALSGTDLVATVDSALGVAPGTTSRVLGSQAGSLAATGNLDWERAALALATGSVHGTPGSLVIAGPPAVDAPVGEYEALGYSAAEAEVYRSMGLSPARLQAVRPSYPSSLDDPGVTYTPPTDPADIRMDAVSSVFQHLSRDPNVTVALYQPRANIQTFDLWSRDGIQVTYDFVNGELVDSRTDMHLVATGVGARMARVSELVDELRANPELTVRASTDYRTGEQRILVTTSEQTEVQYNYRNGTFVSLTHPLQVRNTNIYAESAGAHGVPFENARRWGERAIAGESLISRAIPSEVVAMGQLATVAVHTSGPDQDSRYNGSGVLAVTNIDGVDCAVLITANHVVSPGATTVISARDSAGRLIEIPVADQAALSRGVVDANNRVNIRGSGANPDPSTDAYVVTLTPETLNALRPGVSLSNLPRVGASPTTGMSIYQFGFAAWGNVTAAGDYVGMNLVGAAGTASGGSEGIVNSALAVNGTNPPVTGGMSGGPALVQLPDGSIQVVGVLATSGLHNRATLGTEHASHTSAFASLDWVTHYPASYLARE